MSPWLFWSLLVLMTLMALSFVLLPLLRRRTLAGISRRELNITLYRERLAEIERTRAAGDTGDEEAAAARQELDARLVADAGDDAQSVRAPGMGRAVALALVLALPALAIGIYLSNSDWRLALAGTGPEAITLLLQRLERHLEQEPADAAGWRLLAQSRMQLREFDPAASAYARLNALEPSADTLVGEAEARAMINGGNLQGRPEGLIRQALKLDPNSARAQWYAGMTAWQRGDSAGALDYWNRVAQQELPHDFRSLLERQIEQAGGTAPAAPVRFMIPVEVKLDPQLADHVTGDMPVFIYARAAGRGGPPLAVARRRVADLPLSVVLDDSQSMLPDRKLSSVDRWTIQARIAHQGGAERRSGDLYAETEIGRPQLTAPVRLTINRIVP